MTPDFNLQQLLSDMEKRLREDNQLTRIEITKLTDKLTEQDHRLTKVETVQGMSTWLGRTMVVAFLGAVGDLLFNHIPSLVSKVFK